MELLIFVPRFLLSICAIVCFFPTYSNGQDFFCQALRPANFPTPQPFTTTPYLVITNTTNYEQGNTIEVTVTVKDQSTVTSFSEVFLAASIIGTNEFFGTWTTFMAGQTTEIDCFGGPTVLRFTPPSSQSGIRVLWTLPVDTTTTPPQGFRFTATVVQSDQTFWSLIISETVNIEEIPVVTCPATSSIITNTEGNQIAIWNPPVCLDKEDGPITNRVNCNVTVGSVLPPGDNIIQCMCTDSSENIGTCVFTVTVDGDEAPVVTCPTTSSIITNTEGIEIAVWNNPVCVDEEDGPIENRIDCNVTIGSVLPPGDNIIQCMCTDSSENIGTCVFTVTVDGDEVPDVTCPTTSSIITDTEGNQIAFFNPPECFDKEDGPIIGRSDCNVTTGSVLQPGDNIIQCMCTDSSENIGTCAFTLTAVGDEAPVVTCPTSVSIVTNTEGNQIAIWNPPVCLDKEDGSITNRLNCSVTVGSELPPGDNIIQCMCTDSSENIGTCAFTVTVDGDEAPVVTCPTTSSIVTNTEGIQIAFWNPPVCVDEEDGPIAIRVNCNVTVGSVLPPGDNIIQCMCTDSSENIGTCAFTVTVDGAMNSPPQLTCMDSVSQGMFQSPSCTDAEDPIDQLTVNCNRVDGEILPSDSTYPISCTCVDTSNAMDSCTYILTVPAMNSPPQLTCMNSVSQGMFQSPSCTDAEDPIDQLTVDCNRDDGDILPSDSNNTINCTCVDTSNAMDSCTYILTVPVRFIGDCDIPMLENTIITCPDSGQVNCSFRCDPGTVNAIQKYGPLACTQTDTSFWEPRPLNGLCQVPVQPTAHSVSFTIPLTTSLVNCRNVTLDSGIETYFQNFFEREQDMFCRESRPLDTECTSGVSLEITGQCAMRTLETRRRRRQTNIDQEVIVLLTLDMTSSLGFQSLSDFSGRFNNSLQTLMVPVQLDVATSSYTVEFSAEDQKTIRATDVSYVCPTGHTYIGEGNCVTCPAGTFFDSVGICELCPSGTFQSLSGQASCIECPESSTTRPGATRRSDCESDTTVNPPPEQSLLKEPFIIAGITLAGTLALCVLLLVIVTCFSCFCQGKETPPKQTNISHSEEPTEYHVRSYDNHELRTDDEVEVALQDYATRASDEDSTGYNDNHYAYDAPPSKNDTLDPSSDTESLRMRPTTQL